jgi:hypothetical protein
VQRLAELAGRVILDGTKERSLSVLPMPGSFPISFVVNFDFRCKIRKWALRNSMAYTCDNSRKSNVATEHGQILHPNGGEVVNG